MKLPLTKNSILQDIELIYQLALSQGQWSVALRAKALQGKALGIFMPQRLPEIKRIGDLTEEDLQEFIARLEKNDPQLKKIEFSGPD